VAGASEGTIDPYPENVRALRAIRVLIAARDRRFGRVTSFLLARRGYDVAQSDAGAVVGAVNENRPDVVILEADPSRASSARLVAALEALASPPRIVAVSAAGTGGTGLGIPTVEKWSPVDDLVREIEAASRHRALPSVDGAGVS
jgi:CheY-like chemotaxis protein